MSDKSVLALDVGHKRIGVAIASLATRLPRPLLTLSVDGRELDVINQLVDEHNVDTVVVGLPRGLDGQETDQTLYARRFADKLTERGLSIHLQDEAVTSKQAEQELKSRGKKYRREDIDSLAATYLAEDYLTEHTK